MTVPAFATDWPEDVYVMLLSTDMDNILMVEEGGKWGLPFLHYLESNSRHGNIESWCKDMRLWFVSLPEDTFFTGVVELLGEFYAPSRLDRSKIALNNVMIMEAQGSQPIEACGLPTNANWMRATKVKSIIENSAIHSPLKAVLNIAVLYTKPTKGLRPVVADPRYRLGWFEKASAFLCKTVSTLGSEVCDQVSQKQLSFTSTLLRVNSTSGPYFLKSPALGSAEVLVTAEVTRLFAESSLDLVACSNSLHCFVSRGFTHIPLEVQDIRSLVLELGHFQLKSIPHVNELRNKGVPLRSLDGLERYVGKWTGAESEKWKFMTNLDGFVDLTSTLLEMCRDLKECQIPVVLAHGDAALSNATFNPPESRKVMFFDWEFGHIGHPFCDLYRIRKIASDKVLEEYLQLWSAYIDIDKAWHALDLACTLGWIVKVWAITDCIDACDVQLRSSLEAWARTILHSIQ